MANYYINLYAGNPTAGDVDGTVISTDGSYTAPLIVSLDVTQNQSKIVKLAIRTESGFKTSGSTTISVVGDTDNRWHLALSEDGTFEDSIVIADSISSVNSCFYARASSDSSETPQSDRSASFQVSAIIEEV